jgi:16S rRNA C967 or C1407 C5-methylase (RsmB/RsmF family)
MEGEKEKPRQSEETKKQKEEEYEVTEMPKMELIDWYPRNIVYSLTTNKKEFKKSQMLAELHKYLQRCFDSGLISRQELVSMLPPLYLNVSSQDMVLDMCAAPGSKTS